jgi:hypothetical protein
MTKQATVINEPSTSEAYLYLCCNTDRMYCNDNGGILYQEFLIAPDDCGTVGRVLGDLVGDRVIEDDLWEDEDDARAGAEHDRQQGHRRVPSLNYRVRAGGEEVRLVLLTERWRCGKTIAEYLLMAMISTEMN